MIAALRAEFRKLLTVRSTYVLAAVCLAIAVFVAFYVEGYRAEASAVSNPYMATTAVTSVAQFTSLFIALIGVLLVTHEYRYNTIIHTLLAARRRWQVVAAKIVAVTVVSVTLAVVLALLAPLLVKFGLHAQGITARPQTIDLLDVLLRAVFFTWGYAMLGVVLALIIRSQVGAIVTLLLFPGLGETLLSLVLKDNAKYLPFDSLTQVLSNSLDGAQPASTLSLTTVLLVSLAYIIGGWIIALMLFSRRDAN